MHKHYVTAHEMFGLEEGSYNLFNNPDEAIVDISYDPKNEKIIIVKAFDNRRVNLYSDDVLVVDNGEVKNLYKISGPTYYRDQFKQLIAATILGQEILSQTDDNITISNSSHQPVTFEAAASQSRQILVWRSDELSSIQHCPIIAIKNGNARKPIERIYIRSTATAEDGDLLVEFLTAHNCMRPLSGAFDFVQEAMKAARNEQDESMRKWIENDVLGLNKNNVTAAL